MAEGKVEGFLAPRHWTHVCLSMEAEAVALNRIRRTILRAVTGNPSRTTQQLMVNPIPPKRSGSNSNTAGSQSTGPAEDPAKVTGQGATKKQKTGSGQSTGTRSRLATALADSDIVLPESLDRFDKVLILCPSCVFQVFLLWLCPVACGYCFDPCDVCRRAACGGAI